MISGAGHADVVYANFTTAVLRAIIIWRFEDSDCTFRVALDILFLILITIFLFFPSMPQLTKSRAVWGLKERGIVIPLYLVAEHITAPNNETRRIKSHSAPLRLTCGLTLVQIIVRVVPILQFAYALI